MDDSGHHQLARFIIKIMSMEKFHQLIEEARELKENKGYEEALTLLEEAHLIAQEKGWEHLIVHIEMFKLAIHYRVLSEAIGQIPRMLLSLPGSIIGVFPKGNRGSTRMGIFEKAKESAQDSHSDRVH